MRPHFLVLGSAAVLRVLECPAAPTGRVHFTPREVFIQAFKTASSGVPLIVSVGGGRPSAPEADGGSDEGEGTRFAFEPGLPLAAEWLSEQIDRFLLPRPCLAWAFAAAPVLHRRVLDGLRPSLRGSLVESVYQNLTHVPAADLGGHFKLHA